MSKKELLSTKRIVKKATGRNMNTFDIEAIGYDFVIYSYYATNYDRVTNSKTTGTVVF